MKEKESLIEWNPLSEAVYDRFMHPMFLVNIEFNGELILTVGPEENRYQFSYNRTKNYFYPVRTYRILQEHIRNDIEELIQQKFESAKDQSIPLPNYNPTFYKVENSSFLKWYTTIDHSIPDTELAKLEHHLYICEDYFIDVIAVVQPNIIKL